jgi:phage repressor protein C with HTH and peptisase S24 domain
MQGERIKLARKIRKMNRADLARRSGVGYSTISEVERGATGRTAEIPALARALNFSVDWLADGKGPMELIEPDEDEWPFVLAHRQPASLGPGAEVDEYAETHKLKFRAASLMRKRLKPDALAVCYGKGDSMMPRIHDGDAILFDRSDKEPADGKLYVVTYDGKLLAKQLSLLGGRWFIESLNKDSKDWRKPQPIEEHRHFEIHGRIRWIGSWED